MNKYVLYVIMSSLIYGFTPVLAVSVYGMGANSFTLTFFRSFFLIFILLFIAFIKKIDLRVTVSELLKIAFIGSVGTTLTSLFIYSSYQIIGVGTTATLHYMYPLCVALICAVVYKEKILKNQMISLIICLVGIVFFVDNINLSQISGVLMATGSAFTFAIYLVGIEKFGLSKMNNIKLSIYLSIVAVISLFIVNIFTNQLIFALPVKAYLIMIVISVLVQYFAVIFLKEGVAHLGSNKASIISMLEPVSSVFFGFIFLSEDLTIRKIIGCALIIGGLLFLIKKPKNKQISE